MLFLSRFSNAQTDSIQLSGNLKGLGNNKVWISYTDANGKGKYIGTEGKADYFSLHLPAEQTPVAARLMVSWPKDPEAKPSMPSPPLNFFIGNKDLRAEGDAHVLSVARVTGDAENNAYAALIRQSAKGEARYQELLNRLSQKKSTTDSLKMQEEIRQIFKDNMAAQKKFITSHPDLFASVFLLSRMANMYTANQYQSAWKALSGKYKDTPQGRSITATLQNLAPTMAGTPVFAFERTDQEGNTVSTDLLKGKAYLLDFWGSWCGPCRASHPHLKELYRKYHAKGFEIVAIAQERGKTLDLSKASWLKAIQEDQINWVHVLNQDGIEKQDLVKTFHVNSFPTKILVGQDGKILLRVTASATDDIDKALAKIYGF